MVKCKDCSHFHIEEITPETTRKGCWADVDERNIVKVKEIKYPNKERECDNFFPKIGV